MSIEVPIGACPPSANGELQSGPLTPLTDEFEKMKSALGFLEPLGAEELLAPRLIASEALFNVMVTDYVTANLVQHPTVQHEVSDVYPYRGILVSVAKIYYERQYFRPNYHGPADRARNYQYKEYLRTIFDDMRALDEPSNEHMDALLLGTGVRHPRLPDSPLVQFNTNVMRVLGKIDHNVAPLYVDQMKTAR
jgi:hypothetical protein